MSESPWTKAVTDAWDAFAGAGKPSSRPASPTRRWTRRRSPSDGPASFDLVVSCIALQDMPDPLRVLRGAQCVLAPRGRVVALVSHPTNDTAYRVWERDAAGRKTALRIDRYFETGPRDVTWTGIYRGAPYSFRFPSWTRTLEEWSDIIREAGFFIAGLYFLIFDLVPKPG